MHAGISPQQSAKGSPGPVRKTLANDFQQRQLRAIDALRAKIIGANGISLPVFSSNACTSSSEMRAGVSSITAPRNW
jgi:hypothetical protein